MSAGGLSAEELGAIVGELRSTLETATVRDVARLSLHDDLLVFLDTEHGRRTLHVAPGGARARLCTTRRRFPGASMLRTAQVERLRGRLVGATFEGVLHDDGERSCALQFSGEQVSTLAVELFGTRGLWCLLDEQQVILELSRLPGAGRRQLLPGARYSPPPRRGAAPAGTSRFLSPVCENVDQHFTDLDLTAASGLERKRLAAALSRAQRKAAQRIDGLERQQEQIASTDELRRTADLMLAYGHLAPRGATELMVPHPDEQAEQLRIALDPAQSVHAQAEKLYKKARKLTDAAAISSARLDETRQQHAQLEALAGKLDATADGDLAALADELTAAGVLAAPRQETTKDRKITGGENFRRFESAEGYPIFVGRNNRQNDRLTTRVARGNDLWLHVGQGQSGSHVVVRLPRGKTASLETMLDAATLAVHFSRARGNPNCEVIYTQAKHVRKPKGLPPGSVIPSRTRSITVRHEAARLTRLLDSAS